LTSETLQKAIEKYDKVIAEAKERIKKKREKPQNNG